MAWFQECIPGRPDNWLSSLKFTFLIIGDLGLHDRPVFAVKVDGEDFPLEKDILENRGKSNSCDTVGQGL